MMDMRRTLEQSSSSLYYFLAGLQRQIFEIVPFYRVRSVNSRRLGDGLINGKSHRPIAGGHSTLLLPILQHRPSLPAQPCDPPAARCNAAPRRRSQGFSARRDRLPGPPSRQRAACSPPGPSSQHRAACSPPEPDSPGRKGRAGPSGRAGPAATGPAIECRPAAPLASRPGEGARRTRGGCEEGKNDGGTAVMQQQ